MGTLKINCELEEFQMTAILKEVERKLYATTPKDLEDFDDEIHGVRVCVDYDEFLDKVSIKASEILNSDWDVLYEDTAVFTSRLRAIVENYNKDYKKSYEDALELQKDRDSYCIYSHC